MILPIITGLAAVVVLGFVWYFSRHRRPAPPPAEQPAKPDAIPDDPPNGKKSREPKPRRPPVVAPRPLDTADVVFNVGTTQPITFSIDPSGEYMIVPCRNRQQLLFSVKSVGDADRSRPLHRFDLTEDTIADCGLTRDVDGALVVVAGLDRRKAVASFVLDLATGKSRPGKFLGEAAASYDVQRVAVGRGLAFVAVLGDDTFIRVYNESGRQIFARNTAQMRNTEIAVSAEAEFFAASSYMSDVVVYGVERDRAENCVKAVKAFTLGYHKNSAHTIDFASRSRLVATGGKDNTFTVATTPVEWKQGQDPRRKFSGNTTRGILLVRLAPVAETVAVLLDDGAIVFYTQAGVAKKIEQAIPPPARPEDVRMQWHPTEPWVFVMALTAPFIYAYAAP
jgi:hypothetical protein